MLTAMILNSDLLLRLQEEEVAGDDVTVVMMVTLIIWIGLFVYLFQLDRKVKDLGEQVKSDMPGK